MDTTNVNTLANSHQRDRKYEDEYQEYNILARMHGVRLYSYEEYIEHSLTVEIQKREEAEKKIKEMKQQ